VESEAYWAEKKEYAFRNYIDYIGAGYVMWGDGLIGGGGGLGYYWSLLPFTSIGATGILGGIMHNEDNDGDFVAGLDINAGFVFPLTEKDDGVNVLLFGDGVLQIGWYGYPGLIAEYVTPGFEAGIHWEKNVPGFEIKYKGAWYAGGHYLHGLAFIVSIG
jgi:hypothetical protein